MESAAVYRLSSKTNRPGEPLCVRSGGVEEVWVVQSDAETSNSLNQENLIRLSFKLENHGYVIEIGVCHSTGKFGQGHTSMEQQNVTSIGLCFELTFTHIVEFPWFLYPLCSLFMDVSLT